MIDIYIIIWHLKNLNLKTILRPINTQSRVYIVLTLRALPGPAIIFLRAYFLADYFSHQQYRNMRFTKYSDVMSMLLLANKQNELLLKNHGERPTGVFPMQSHATHVPTTRFTSKGSKRRSKLEKRSRTPLQRTTQRAYKRPTPQPSQKNRFSESPSTQPFFQDNRTCFECGTKGHIAKSCKTAPHLVKLYKEHDERHDAHATHVEHMVTPYEETTADPFGDMESHTISGDTEPNTLNISLLVNSATTDTILRDKKCFSYLGPVMTKHITTVTGSHLISYQIGEACLVMPKGTHIRISRVVYLPMSTRNLLSFQDIRRNGFHLRTAEEDNQELLQILDREGCPIENIPAYSSRMYIVPLICLSEREDVAFCVNTWHERMGHPGVSMMRRISLSTKGHNFQVLNLVRVMKPCEFCALEKFVSRPHKWKLPHELPVMFQRIKGDICGPIDPPCGPFRYCFGLIDASTKWSHVSLLASRNQVFPRLLAQIIQFRARFPDHPISPYV